ncbi:hypothetical protein HY285_05915 [Candidatus Peregrinibacteria bacterium]|nr:hypothetical protein [Candidatus Peregrinibacteria bacterium]MBI3817042.1 hypothetical protein [Candidatus Peregrinibacteria bacterium]
MTRFSLRRLEKDFAAAPSEKQRLFLMRLPQLLDLSPTGPALLRTSEPSFEFWNNSDDAAYDTL